MISLYLTLSGREQMLGQHTDENRGPASVLGVFTLQRAVHTGRRQNSEKRKTHFLAGEESSASNYVFLHSFTFFYQFIFCFFWTVLLTIMYLFVGGVQRRRDFCSRQES